MIGKSNFTFVETIDDVIVRCDQLWDGGITFGENLGDKVKFAVAGFITDIHYKYTKRGKMFKVVYGLDIEDNFSFALFNNEQIFKNKAYIFVGYYNKGWFILTKYHELKQLNNGDKNECSNVGRTIYQSN
jgi:hypothetical protein